MLEHVGYKPGRWLFICDECGRTFYDDEAKVRWDQAMVCKRCWEPRQPQDFIRPIMDDQSTPWARPWVPILAQAPLTTQFHKTDINFNITAGKAGNFPQPVYLSSNFIAVLTDDREPSLMEYVRIGSVSDPTFISQARGVNGTVALDWEIGAVVTVVGPVYPN